MIKYPNSRKEYLVENIFGKQVEDSYRWMEDESHKDLSEWIDSQNALTQSHLQSIGDRDQIKARLKELNDFSKYENIRVIGEYIIYQYNDGLQNQSVYYIQKGLEGHAQILIDPNTLSEDGTVAIDLGGHSKDNRYLAYLQAAAGSDWHIIRIIDLETLELLEDQLEWVKFTFTSWRKDGFYYSAFDAPEKGKVLSEKNTDMKVFYHKLGQDQSEDQEIYADPDHPLRYHTIFSTDNQEDLVLASRAGTYGSEIKIYSEKDQAFKCVFEGFASKQNYVGSKDDLAYFISDEEAANKKIVAVNTKTLDVETLIDESDSNIEEAYIIKDHLILVCLEDVKALIKIYTLEGNFKAYLELPGIGTPSAFTSSEVFDEIFFTFTSYIQPNTLYSFTLENLKAQIFKNSNLPYDVSDYVTEQIFIESKDGTMIPAFATYKKGLKLDGKNPTMLYAYGGFSIPMRPAFKPSVIYFIEGGGIHVEASIRGGSEYGEAWHKAGMLLNKQNVFDDFIAVAEGLIEKGYTSKDYLAISGRSNGGLLMGAISNQRPDLFSVVFPTVGVMDMLRYHKFTIGWGWAVEYGNPDEEVHFNNIYKYSPLHNIEKKDYPATMVLTADHDDRVVPAHSFKYIARLQEMNTSDQPMLIRIDKNSGHGAGKSTEKLIDENADKLAFLFHHIK